MKTQTPAFSLYSSHFSNISRFTHVLNSSSLLSLDTKTISNGLPAKHQSQTATRTQQHGTRKKKHGKSLRAERAKTSVDDGNWTRYGYYSLMQRVKRVKVHCAREVLCHWFGYVHNCSREFLLERGYHKLMIDLMILCMCDCEDSPQATANYTIFVGHLCMHITVVLLLSHFQASGSCLISTGASKGRRRVVARRPASKPRQHRTFPL